MINKLQILLEVLVASAILLSSLKVKNKQTCLKVKEKEGNVKVKTSSQDLKDKQPHKI